MATMSLWKVESRMDHVIDYVVDTNKTIELQQVLNYTTNEEKTININTLLVSTVCRTIPINP